MGFNSIRNSGLVFFAFIATVAMACDDGSSDDGGDDVAATDDTSGGVMEESTGDGETGSITTGITTALTTMSSADESSDGSDGSGDTGVTGELSCESYCGVYMEACTDFSEYDNVEACMAHCGQWPVGAETDTAGDTLGCRLYHVTVASSTDAAIHCPHSAPNGADVCFDAGSPDCATYCDTYMGNCTEDNGVYIDMDDCLAQCAPWYPGTTDDTAGNTIGCRTYHSGAPAFGDPATHCPHAGPGGDAVCVF